VKGLREGAIFNFLFTFRQNECDSEARLKSPILDDLMLGDDTGVS